MKQFLISLILIFNIMGCVDRNKVNNRSVSVKDTSIIKNARVIEKEQQIVDSIKKEIIKSKVKLHLSVLDTVQYKFILEDVGTEGTEGIAYYLNDSLRKIRFKIYTSMGQIHLNYVFNESNIDVIEERFSNKSDIATVQYGKDLELTKTLSYRVDNKGMPVKKVDSDRVDVFQELKKNVPFELK